jgi:hypothetical protein
MPRANRKPVSLGMLWSFLNTRAFALTGNTATSHRASRIGFTTYMEMERRRRHRHS